MARRKNTRRKPSQARQTGLGVLFWLCLAVIIVAVGFAARDSVKAAFTQLSGKHPPSEAPAPEAPKVTVAPLPSAPSTAPEASSQQASPEQTAPTAQQQRTADQSRPSSTQRATPNATPSAPANAPASTLPTPATRPETPVARKARLFFTTVDQNGKIALKSVIRPIPASDSPLRDVIENLLKGPTGQEMNLGMLSMIPTDARLRGVTVKGDTAYLDFSESFRLNPQGMDAMAAQVKQVVYAATEFPTVKKVQILIEGKTVRYLGPEGLRIDEPFTRASFEN